MPKKPDANLSLSLFLLVFVCLSLSLVLFLLLVLFLCLSLSLSLSLRLSLSPSLSVSPALSLSLSLYVFLFVFVFLSLSFFMYGDGEGLFSQRMFVNHAGGAHDLSLSPFCATRSAMRWGKARQRPLQSDPSCRYFKWFSGVPKDTPWPIHARSIPDPSRSHIFPMVSWCATKRP